MGLLIPSEEQMQALTVRLGVEPDANYMLVQRIVHPEGQKVTKVLDALSPTSILTGMTEKSSAMVVTPTTFYVAPLPWSFDVDRIAAKVDQIDHSAVTSFKVYQKSDQVHIEFDYSNQHFHSHQLAKYWGRGEYNVASLKNLLATGFFGLMVPSEL